MTLLGKKEPRIWTKPLRKLTPKTSLGFACIDFAEEVLNITLLDWQKWLLIHALELLPDNNFRFRTVLVLVARQNGKSTLAQVLSLFCMYVSGVALVIGTAQTLDIAEEVWEGAVELASGTPELASEIKHISRINGGKALKLTGGERYKVQTATRRGGRGLSADLILLDELREHQNWDAWSAISKTTLAKPRAQIWCLSNAGDASSVVLRSLRKKAHKELGDPDGINKEIGSELLDTPESDVQEIISDNSLGIFEWSAVKDCGLSDTNAWQSANPSLGKLISEKAIRSNLTTDPEWVFRTEVLCQWSDGNLEGLFPPGAWEKGIDNESIGAKDSERFYGLDVSYDRSHAYIGSCSKRTDGDWHIEIVAGRLGLDWIAPLLEKQCKDKKIKLAAQGRGAPVTSLLDELRGIQGLEIVDCVGAEIGNGTGRFFDAVAAHVLGNTGEPKSKLWHRKQPVLDIAAATAVSKPLGDGAWGFDRRNSPADCAPIVAVSMAFWLATKIDNDTPTISAYETADLLVLD
jgi:hypothetical protein